MYLKQKTKKLLNKNKTNDKKISKTKQPQQNITKTHKKTEAGQQQKTLYKNTKSQ